MNETNFYITFGDSWTFGEGSAYKDGMNQPQYEQIQHDPDLCWENGWRKRVVEHFDFDHINFGLVVVVMINSLE